MSTMRPVVVLMLDEDIAAMAPYLDESITCLPHMTGNGWSDEMLQRGVLFHALLGALEAGDVELVRIPRDASGVAS